MDGLTAKLAAVIDELRTGYQQKGDSLTYVLSRL